MNMKVETLPQYRVAYVRQVGPYGPANMQAMEKLKKWAEEKDLIKSAIILGIPQDNPKTTLPENCRYDACIVISEDYQIDDSICEGELSGGKYVIFKVKHTAEATQKAWAEIFPALHNSGYQIDNKPILERYTSEMINNHYCEICVPVKVL
ncbi:DNA gyrase inhibitor [Bacillus pseudomycoides]|uniref:DNA gyrase inhibitor n=1 Tax=Bacillus pseudomycoides TaxID=64104 RepID=A0AA91VAE3_9BACI|nr:MULTISPECIES: GyrI-like domain-containing protein [Bacillus]PEB54078.1 DNA gyrase inhibitor [Bacillus sp. AFS098217]PED81018.1 DNA gyrase inhibitor [Bacillus pseudomycoides]PEU21659.1 DNA gyrase inhibitor [Bacillus sp. AFS014408]PFW57427.1 DNA gyrase inhibitor [Bacillus sp. AFS075034]